MLCGQMGGSGDVFVRLGLFSRFGCGCNPIDSEVLEQGTELYDLVARRYMKILVWAFGNVSQLGLLVTRRIVYALEGSRKIIPPHVGRLRALRSRLSKLNL